MAFIFGPEYQGRNLQNCMGTPSWRLVLHVAMSKTCYLYEDYAFNIMCSLSFQNSIFEAALLLLCGSLSFKDQSLVYILNVLFDMLLLPIFKV